MKPSAIVIERLVVKDDRVVAYVRVAPFARMSTPSLAARLREAFPSIAHHACVNEKGDSFAAVMDCTPLPHVLEHVVIELQMRSLSGLLPALPDRFAFLGATEWTNEPSGLARVEVNFADDLVALRAFCDAARFLNRAVLR